MAKNKLADLDLTFSNNTDALGQSTAGSANVSTIDTIFQKVLTLLALFYDEIGGTGTVGGTADAITLATNGTYVFQALASGLITAFKASGDNTGAATINVDSLGAKAIRRQGDSALSAGDIVADGIYLLRYDTAYNSSAGAWVLLNPTVSAGSISPATTTQVLTGTDTSAYVTADALAAIWEKGSDVASGSTVSLGEGGLFHITGTATITDIDFSTAKNGRAAWLIFDGALTLTHNSTTLVIDGGASVVTAAGDMAFVVQDASDNVYVRFFPQAASATSVTGTWTLIGSISTGSGSSKTQALGATYKELRIVLDGISLSSGSEYVRVAITDDGVTYGTAVRISAALNSTNDVISGTAIIMNTGVASTTKYVVPNTHLETSAGAYSTSSHYTTVGADGSENGVTNSIKFTPSSGSFDAGTITVYGLT